MPSAAVTSTTMPSSNPAKPAARMPGALAADCQVRRLSAGLDSPAGANAWPKRSPAIPWPSALARTISFNCCSSRPSLVQARPPLSAMAV